MTARKACCITILFEFHTKVLDDGTLLKRYRKEIRELKKQLVEVCVLVLICYYVSIHCAMSYTPDSTAQARNRKDLQFGLLIICRKVPVEMNIE